jgi:hypothetical protein
MTVATLVALGIGIFILPTAVGYAFGFRDKTPEQLTEENKGEEQ